MSVIIFIPEPNQNKHLENCWLKHLKSELIHAMHFYLPLILISGTNQTKNEPIQSAYLADTGK